MTRTNRKQVVNSRSVRREWANSAAERQPSPPVAMPQGAVPQPEYYAAPAAPAQPEYYAPQPVMPQPTAPPPADYYAPPMAPPQPEYYAPPPGPVASQPENYAPATEYYAAPAAMPQGAVPQPEYYAPTAAPMTAPPEYYAPQPVPQAAAPQAEYYAPQMAPQAEPTQQPPVYYPAPGMVAQQFEYNVSSVAQVGYPAPAAPAYTAPPPVAQPAAPPEAVLPPSAPVPEYDPPQPVVATPPEYIAPQPEYHAPQAVHNAPPQAEPEYIMPQPTPEYQAPQPVYYAPAPPVPQSQQAAAQADYLPPQPEYHAPQAEYNAPPPAEPEYVMPQAAPAAPLSQPAQAELAPLELDALAYVAAQSPLMSENQQEWQYAHTVYQRAVDAQQQWNGGQEAPPQTQWDPYHGTAVDTGIDASGSQYQSVDAQEWAASVLDQVVNLKDWSAEEQPTVAPPAMAAPQVAAPPVTMPLAAVPPPEAVVPQIPLVGPEVIMPPAQQYQTPPPVSPPDYDAPPQPEPEYSAPQAEAVPPQPQHYQEPYQTPVAESPATHWQPQGWTEEAQTTQQAAMPSEIPEYQAPPQPEYHAPRPQPTPPPQMEQAPPAVVPENTWQAYAQEPQAMTSEWSFLNLEQTVEEQLEQQNSPMKVALLAYTPEPEKVVAAAARLCYSPKSGVELMENFTEEKVQEFLSRLSQQGHFSPFEHAVFTFAVDGVSRSLSHQLVRHRLASYSQKSQRYVKENGFHYIIPPSINADPDLKRTFNSLMRRLEQVYDEFVAAGVPAEDARAMLPNAATTNLVITMNARSLHNFFRLRCCRRAQAEIRQLANLMLSKVKRVAPNLFAGAGATCQTEGICYEGEMSCGLVDVPVRVGKSH